MATEKFLIKRLETQTQAHLKKELYKKIYGTARQLEKGEGAV